MRTLANNSTLRIAHKTLACLLVFCIVNMPLWALSSSDITSLTNAALNGGVPGAVSIGIDGKGIVEWSQMNVDINDAINTLQFTGADGAAVLNRVATQISFNGILDAEGIKVFMVGPGGIIGQDAQITASSFTMSGLNLSNSNFLNGVYQYEAFDGVTIGETTINGVFDVTNNANITNVSEMVALLGGNVVNEGTISVPEGTVIMAAGDSILITGQNSNVAVQISIPDGANPSDYSVNHNDGDIEAQHVRLAAGDIWASAAIEAYDKASSDAVATLDITAKGDLEISDEVGAYAVGDFSEGDNATATVTVTVGGDVNIEADEDNYAGLYSEAYDGPTNTANLTVNAEGDIRVSGQEDAWTYIYAETSGGTTNTSTIDVTAKGDVELDATDSAWAGIEAYAHEESEEAEAVTNTASIMVDAENIEVSAKYGDDSDDDDYNAYIWTEAEDAETNKSSITLTAKEDIEVTAYEDAYAHVHAEANDGQTNTATVTATAGEDIEVEAEYDSEAEIIALVDDGGTTNTTTVTANAGEDIEVYAYDYSWAGMQAEVYSDSYPEETVTNKSTVAITAGESVSAIAEYDSEVDLDSEAWNGTSNTATTTINAVDYVVVEASDDSDAAVEAEAMEGTTSNTATVNITVTGDPESEKDMNGDVRVTADDDSEAEIEAVAASPWQNDRDETLETVNTATVEIDAAKDVIVGAINESYADIDAEANTSKEDRGEDDPRQKAKSNTAVLTINAGRDVLLTGEDYGSAEIEAETEHAVDNTSTLTINAGRDVSLFASSNEGNVEIEAEAEYADNKNTATVIVDAVENVSVEASGEYCYADIEAEAEDGTALYWNDDDGDDDDDYRNKENLATITVKAGKDVTVSADSYECYADIEAEAEDGEKNTATVLVDAGEDVDIEADGEGCYAYIETEAEDGIVNTSTTTVNAGKEIFVSADGDGYWADAHIEAEAEDSNEEEPEDATNTATVNLNAGGTVIVASEDDGFAEIEADAREGIANTAEVDILANNVLVIACDDSQAQIQAKTENYDYCEDLIEAKNSAAVNIETFTVEVEEDSGPQALESRTLLADGLDGIDSFLGDGIGEVLGDLLEAGGHVVVASIDDSSAQIKSEAYGATENIAATTINAQGSVFAAALNGNYGDDDNGPEGTGVFAYAQHATLSNDATVDITANNVLAIAANEADARIKARAAYISKQEVYKPDNGDIYLQAENGDYGPDGTSNTANVKIETFKVEIEKPVQEESAAELILDWLYGDGSLDPVVEDVLYDIVDGGHVLVGSYNGGDTQVEATTYGGSSGECGYGANSVDNADVLVCAEGIVAVGALSTEASETNAEIKATSHFAYENNASVSIGAQQGLGVIAVDLSEGFDEPDDNILATVSDFEKQTFAGISSTAAYGHENSADVVTCTGGPALAAAVGEGADAVIDSTAYAGDNVKASTALCADSLAMVIGAWNGNAEISSMANTDEIDGPDALIKATQYNGYGPYPGTSAEADTVVVSNNSGIAVVAVEEADAGIASYALNAYENDAYTGVCGKDHLIVAAGIENMLGEIGDLADLGLDLDLPDYGYSGGEAYITSEAGYDGIRNIAASSDVVALQQIEEIEDPSTSNAETAVISKEGSILLADMTSDDRVGSVLVSSEAHDTDINTAYTGVAAGANLSPSSLNQEQSTPEPDSGTIIEFLEYLYRYGGNLMLGGPGNVLVIAEGPDSSAKIISEASSGFENTADTVVCAPGKVSVESYGNDSRSIATIKSRARWGEIDNATTQVYASSVYVNVDSLRSGNGIGAYGDGGWINIDNDTAYDGYGDGYPSDGGWYWNADTDDPIEFPLDGEDGSTLIIDSYAKKQDCPDCPPCPDCPCDEDGFPVAPLPLIELPKLSGCPTEMDAASAELGINSDTLQLRIADAMATNPNLQPCDACRSLLTSAAALQDPDGSRMAALAQVFNTLAPADAPFTPEVSTSIATAFADMSEKDAQYALASEYVDAFANYVAILENDLKSPVGDPVALVLEKYGDPITGSDNPNIAAYIMAQMVGGSL